MTSDEKRFPTCETCGRPMVLGQRKRHYLCDPDGFPNVYREDLQ